ncbi:MAG: hypothetical protein EBS53_03745 [Bacteroidetes bacterium]|nr:hypothetical protein [Bacteroidota bacterium]
MGFFASSGILNRRGFFGGAFSPFSPSSIPNLGLWLDANVGVDKDGSNLVTRWYDQSGNGRNVLQFVASRKPTFLSNELNGKPAINFFYDSLGTGKVLFGNTRAFMWKAGAASVFVVLQSNKFSTLENAFLISERSPSPVAIYGIVAAQTNALTKLNAFISSEGTTFLPFKTPNGYGTAYDQAWRIATMIDDGNYMNGYVDGVLGNIVNYSITPNRAAWMSPVDLFIGAGTNPFSLSQSPTSSFSAKVAEIIIYSRALNNTERVQVGNYLKSKWGI